VETLNKVLSTKLFSLGEGQDVTILQLLVTLFLIAIGLWIARSIEKKLSTTLTERQVNQDIVQLFRRIFQILVLIALITTILSLLNVPLASFAFITGAVAIGIGFGAQNIINNFISGWILMWERPIRIGDFLELGDMRGTVEAINTRSTRMKRIDGVRLLIPNSQLLENVVINWTIMDRMMRSAIRVGVQYGSDVELVKQLLEKILTENSDVLEDPAPNVIFEDFGDSALIFDAFFWIETTSERSLRGVRSELRFTVDKVFKENNIVIAFPQRDIHVDGTLKIER
jgi:small-conductance mechanosensitive channel